MAAGLVVAMSSACDPGTDFAAPAGGPDAEDAGDSPDAGGLPDAGAGDGGAEPISFSAQVAPILAASCAGCHPGYAPMSLRPDDAWASLVDAPSVGCPDGRLRVTSGNPDPKESYLMAKLLGVELCGGSGAMPPSGSLPAEQIEVIRTWIAQGAR